MLNNIRFPGWRRNNRNWPEPCIHKISRFSVTVLQAQL